MSDNAQCESEINRSMPQAPLSSPPGIGRHLFGIIGGCLSTAVLFLTLIFFNALQTLSLLMLPFSRTAFRKFNRWAANTWWGWCVLTARGLYGSKIQVYGDEIPEKENAILVANHQCAPDINYLLSFARDKYRLGDLKWFAKDIIKYIPGIGWGMLFLDCLFVKRAWAKDKASIEKTFSRLNRDDVPFWMILFVEGHRLTDERLDKSQRIAKNKGKKPLMHLLTARPMGFYASFVGVRKKLDAVYDMTIGYADGVPTLWQFLKGDSRVMHLHVKRYLPSDMPEKKEELAAWLHKRFEEKDARLDNFYKTGSFE